MRQRAEHRRRLPVKAVRTLVFTLAAVPLAALAAYSAAVGYYGAFPERAPAALESHAAVVLSASDDVFLGDETVAAAERSRIEKAAREVLQDSPLSAAAMRQLGFVEAARGGQDFADELRTAERISRRDLPAQVALFDLAAARSDYRAAVEHLDKVLSVAPQAGAAVYPMLASGMGDSELRTALARGAARPWFRGLVRTVATAAEPRDAVALIESSGVAVADDPDIVSGLLGRLVEDGDYAAARAFAIAHGGAKPKALEAFGFSAATTDPAFVPLTWQIVSDQTVRSQLAGGATLASEVEAGRHGTLAERVTHLQAGGYVLEQSVGSESRGPGVSLEWSVACGAAGDGVQVWRQSVPVPSGEVRYASRFRVPEGCPLQRWRLGALAGDAQSPAQVEIGELALRRE